MKSLFNLKSIVIVLLVTGGLTTLVLGLKTLGGASATATPQNVLVSDVRGSDVSISWITPERAESKVYYGTTPALGTEITQPGISTAHLVDLSNLTPNTTYYFAIGDQNQKYTQDGPAGAVPYTFRTLAVVENAPAAESNAPSQQVALTVAGNAPAPASAFKDLIIPNQNSKVLAEATGSGSSGTSGTGGNSGSSGTSGNNGSSGNSGSSGTPNGATTWPTIILAAAASLLVGLGFKLLKD